MTTKLSSDYHKIKLVNNVAGLFDVNNNTSKLSDVQIRIGNRTYYCHKLILQLSSEYFVEMECQSNTVILQSVHPDQFFDVLQFMYTGEVLVDKDNVESLLTASDIFCMDDLKKVCLCFLEDYVSISNALLYWRLGIKYGSNELVRKCQTRVREDFKKLNSLSSLGNASEDMMRIILSDDNLDVKSEVEVVEILMKWLQVQTETGQKVRPDQLLPLIRWSGMSVDYVSSKLLKCATLTLDPASISFLSKVITYLLSEIQFDGLQTFHRSSTGLDNCLMIVGLDHHAVDVTASIDIYCVQLQHPHRLRKLTAVPTKMNLGSAACLLNHNIYITGVGDLGKETWTWNVVSGWIRCADMLTGRLLHCPAVVDSILYVLGGFNTDKQPLSTVECYNTKTNKWSSAGHLIHKVIFAACVTYKGLIYVFGGEDKDSRAVTHVQVYNPAQETCTVMAKPMPRACSNTRAVLWETYIILLDYETCFIYNFETQIWQEREQFKTDVGFFASTLENSTVYIAGGGSFALNNENKPVYTDEIKSVPVLDIINDKPAEWKHHSKLAKPAMIISCINISLPSLNSTS